MDKASGYVANEFEWAATQLNKGDQCWFRKRNGRFGTGEELGPWKWGTYLSSYFYDGMIARVAEADPDDLIEHSLFLDLGDQISATRP
jgi:hypothetical protein